jgi:hypothetical protein
MDEEQRSFASKNAFNKLLARVGRKHSMRDKEEMRLRAIKKPRLSTQHLVSISSTTMATASAHKNNNDDLGSTLSRDSSVYFSAEEHLPEISDDEVEEVEDDLNEPDDNAQDPFHVHFADNRKDLDLLKAKVDNKEVVTNTTECSVLQLVSTTIVDELEEARIQVPDINPESNINDIPFIKKRIIEPFQNMERSYLNKTGKSCSYDFYVLSQ